MYIFVAVGLEEPEPILVVEEDLLPLDGFEAPVRDYTPIDKVIQHSWLVTSEFGYSARSGRKK